MTSRHPAHLIRLRLGRRPRQRGASLIVVLVLVLALGLMALTAFYLSRGQYQLAGNIQHQEQAFMHAETASAVAEQWISVSANAASTAFDTYDSTAKGLYPIGKLTALGLDPKSMTWGDSNSIVVGEGRYLIERLARAVKLPGSSLQGSQRATGACRAVDLYRIVARSSGTRGASRTVEVFYAAKGCA